MASHPLIELADLASALGVEQGELISLIGGGGKTTSLFTLGAQLQGTTVMTTTTKMGAEQTHGYQVLLDPTDAELVKRLNEQQRVLAWQEAEGRRALGVGPERCDRWFDLADNLITEADGSRKRPFKAPVDYEPVVPSRTTLLVACIGASALGQPIETSCHRSDRVAAIAECEVTDLLTPARAAAVLSSEHGSRKGLPEHARFAVLVHRVRPDHVDDVAELAGYLPDETVIAVRAMDRPLPR